jgi:hypothetical protein
VQSFRRAEGRTKSSAEGASRVTSEISPVGDSCLLKLSYDQLREDADDQVYGDWPRITTTGSLRRRAAS